MRTQSRGLRAVVGISLVALIAGCGGTAATNSGTARTPAATNATAASVVPAVTPAATAADQPAQPSIADSSGAACSIFTKEAVAAAVGFSIATTSGIATTCFFQNTDVSRYLTVQLYDSDAAMSTPLQMEIGSDHVAGLGDDAFWVPVAGILFVRKGTHALELSDSELAMSPETDTAKRQGFITLARIALPGL